MWIDVASGSVQGGSGSYAAAASVLQTGNGRPIAVPTRARMKKLPDVGTFFEQGLTDIAFQVQGFICLVGPIGMPRELVRRLSDMMVEGGKSERIVKILDKKNVIVFGNQNKAELIEMLPRVADHLTKAEFKEGDSAVLSYYETSDGKKIATWIRRGRTVLSAFDDITVRVRSQEMTLRPGKVERRGPSDFQTRTVLSLPVVTTKSFSESKKPAE